MRLVQPLLQLNFSILSSKHASERVQVCSNKTLFKIAGNGLDLVHQLQFANPGSPVWYPIVAHSF